MDIEAYIESGILELYVAGSLSEKQNEEVYALMQKHPNINKEVLDIEAAIIKLTAATSKKDNKHILQRIKQDLFNNHNTKVIPIVKPKYNGLTYTGWAAAIILGVGLLYNANKNTQLQADLQIAETQQDLLETEMVTSKNNLVDANKLIAVLRDDAITKIPLAGQAGFETAFAKVYWNKNAKRIYLDAQGLPKPPNGKVYQVWSLTLNPLTPTSLGTIDSFTTDTDKIFEIENANKSEAFGITLEPIGGSASPTMEQLYTLGVISS